MSKRQRMKPDSPHVACVHMRVESPACANLNPGVIPLPVVTKTPAWHGEIEQWRSAMRRTGHEVSLAQVTALYGIDEKLLETPESFLTIGIRGNAGSHQDRTLWLWMHEHQAAILDYLARDSTSDLPRRLLDWRQTLKA